MHINLTVSVFKPCTYVIYARCFLEASTNQYFNDKRRQKKLISCFIEILILKKIHDFFRIKKKQEKKKNISTT